LQRSKKIARNKQKISKKCRGWDLNPQQVEDIAISTFFPQLSSLFSLFGKKAVPNVDKIKHLKIKVSAHRGISRNDDNFDISYQFGE